MPTLSRRLSRDDGGTARRRGGALTATVGFLGVGVSSAALLAAGPRILGNDSFSGLALVWTLASVFGFGLATPAEQVITRRLNVRMQHASRAPLRWLLIGAGVFVVISFLLGQLSAAADNFAHLGLNAVIAIVSWVAVVAVRSRIAGVGDLHAYTLLLGVEAVVRLILVGLAFGVRDRPGSAEVILGLAVGAPLLCAALAGTFVRVGLSPAAPAPETVRSAGALGGEQLAFVAVSLGFQACLNAPPLLLEWRLGSSLPAVVGAFVAANSYFRMPAVFMGGVSTHALVELSHAWGTKDLARFRASLWRALRTALVVSVAVVGCSSVAAPVVLEWFYGSPLRLPIVLLVALAVSTVVAVVCVVLVQSLLASGRGRAAGLSWLAGAVTTLAVVGTSSGTNTQAAIGLLLGPLVALVGVILAVSALVREHADA